MLEDKIKNIIDELNPYIELEGGKIEFVKYENSKVYIKMLGACSNCEFVDSTVKDSIEEVIVNEIPEVKEVIKID
ncbi:MAG: NifU family protein [bacterium]|nr:NifU family protein [bacterium]